MSPTAYLSPRNDSMMGETTAQTWVGIWSTSKAALAPKPWLLVRMHAKTARDLTEIHLKYRESHNPERETTSCNLFRGSHSSDAARCRWSPRIRGDFPISDHNKVVVMAVNIS